RATECVWWGSRTWSWRSREGCTVTPRPLRSWSTRSPGCLLHRPGWPSWPSSRRRPRAPRCEVGLRRADARCLLQPQLLDCCLAHLELLDLSGHGHRELVDELPVPRDLVAADPATAVRGQVVAGKRRALAESHPCHDLFAVLFTGHSEHLDVGDVRVAVEELLHLARVDVFATADDHVFDPPHDVQ